MKRKRVNFSQKRRIRTNKLNPDHWPPTKSQSTKTEKLWQSIRRSRFQKPKTLVADVVEDHSLRCMMRWTQWKDCKQQQMRATQLNIGAQDSSKSRIPQQQDRCQYSNRTMHFTIVQHFTLAKRGSEGQTKARSICEASCMWRNWWWWWWWWSNCSWRGM